MPTIRQKVRSIESLLPSVDARNATETLLLDGKNFMFGPLGPGSLFGSRRLSALPMYAPQNVQGIRLQDRTFVFADDSILTWRETPPFMWELLFQFDGTVPNTHWTPWSAIYYTSRFIFCHPFRGTFTASPILDSQNMWVKRQTDLTIPGLPTGILGAVVARNRGVFVTRDTIYWTNTDDFTDLTPALAGAGFQRINSFVQGTFLAITGFGEGFVVWTTGGAILAEFVDGDFVWRWSVMDSKERPIGPWAMQELTTGASVFLSRRGVILSRDDAIPSGWTPEFNEFLLTYMRDRANQTSQWRVDYDSNTETLFFSESADRSTYYNTLVLSPTRNKWGIFSERHYGLLPLTNSLFGYVDQQGGVHYFDHTLYSREAIPDNAAGLDLYYPLQQKQMRIVSSSVVSNNYRADETQPMSPFDPLDIAWYAPGIDQPAQPALGGMDSWIEVGYLRPEELQISADGQIEIQEIVLGSIPTRVTDAAYDAAQWKAEAFYPESEDWNSIPSVDTFDIVENWSTLPDEVVNLVSLPDTEPTENWTHLVEYVYTFDDDGTEDWNDDGEDEDWNGLGINFPTLDYQLYLQSSQDGITFAEFVPDMARFNHAAQQFTKLTSGNLHRLRLQADVYGEYYQLRALEFTVQYAGELI